MRIATVNLARTRPHGWKIAPAIRQTFQDIAADIWILTETHAGFAPTSAYPPQSSRFDATVHTPDEYWVMVWSQYPILTWLPTRMPHLTVCCEIVLPIGHAIVYGTVIPDGTAKPWQAHYQAIALQHQDWQELRRMYPNHLFCVAGDFNQNRGGPHVYGTTHGRQLLTDAFADVELTCVTEGAVGVRGTHMHVQTIDHICVNHPWDVGTIVRAWEPTTTDPTTNDSIRMSDHNGVYIDLSP